MISKLKFYYENTKYTLKSKEYEKILVLIILFSLIYGILLIGSKDGNGETLFKFTKDFFFKYFTFSILFCSTLVCLKIFDKNYILLSRLKTKKDYIKYIMSIVIICNIITYIIIILLLVIITAFFGGGELIFGTYKPYNIGLDLYTVFVFIKYFFIANFIVLICFLTFRFIHKILGIVCFVFLCLINDFFKLDPSPVTSFKLNYSYYLSNSYFKSFSTEILYFSIEVIIFIVVIYILYKISTKKNFELNA